MEFTHVDLQANLGVIYTFDDLYGEIHREGPGTQ